MLGRGYTFPIALEGVALKLKEISYIHAEGYSAAEMKHGPIALIDKITPTVFLVPQDAMYDKTMANLAMIRARQGPIIALATEGDKQIRKVADDVIYLPKALEPIYPILATVPLQLFAYHIAVARGLRRGQAAQSRQERDGGVSPITEVQRRGLPSRLIGAYRIGRSICLTSQIHSDCAVRLFLEQ